MTKTARSPRSSTRVISLRRGPNFSMTTPM